MSSHFMTFVRTAIFCSATMSVLAEEPSKGGSESDHKSLSGVLVLENCDPEYKGKESYDNNLSFINSEGKLVFRLSDFNICESIGSNHMMAADSQRNCFWVLENVKHQIRKFDPAGKELLTIKDIQASALAVDPETGHLWVIVSKGTINGDHIDVLDDDGKSVATYAVGGWDIAYDSKTKAFRIAGPTLAKIDAQTGKIFFNKKITAWCASSLDVNSKSGTVWVTVRRHPDVPDSANSLLAFNNDGLLIKSVDLGEGSEAHPILPFCVSVDQRDGSVWVALLRYGVRRYSSTGELEMQHMMWALTAQADSNSHGAWVVTSRQVVQVSSDGKDEKRHPTPKLCDAVNLNAGAGHGCVVDSERDPQQHRHAPAGSRCQSDAQRDEDQRDR